jgi:hypothetical protein
MVFLLGWISLIKGKHLKLRIVFKRRRKKEILYFWNCFATTTKGTYMLRFLSCCFKLEKENDGEGEFNYNIL